MAAKKGEEPKRFRVSARTILQFGGELISADGIAEAPTFNNKDLMFCLSAKEE